MEEIDTVRILIVDDDPGNADYLSRILSNYTTRVFTNPGDALKHFTNSRYDLIVSDQKMPDMSGIELIKACRMISEDFLGIIVSAYTDSDDLINAVNSNVIYRYMIKPFLPETLLQNIQRSYETLSLIRRNKKLEQKLHEENVRLQEENTRLKGEVPHLLIPGLFLWEFPESFCLKKRKSKRKSCTISVPNKKREKICA